MKKLFIFHLSLMIVLTLASHDAHAKCGMWKYTVKGTIKIQNSRNPQDLSPLEGAQLYIYFDEAESTFSEGYGTKYPDYFRTTKNGEYEATAFFEHRDTVTFFGGTTCKDYDPNIVEVIILREGKISERRIFHQKDFKVSGTLTDKVMLLPEITNSSTRPGLTGVVFVLRVYPDGLLLCYTAISHIKRRTGNEGIYVLHTKRGRCKNSIIR